MKLSKTLPLSVSVAVALVSGGAHAFDVSMGAKAGTLGYGADVSVPVTDSISVRGGFSKFSFNYDGAIDSSSEVNGANVSSTATYTTTLDFNTVSLLADYHPFHSGFRLSGGAMLNNNKLSATATAGDQTISIGDYESTQGADLTADVAITFPATAPYLGLGYDSSPYSRSGLSFTFDAGVMFQGEPNADVKLSGADASQVSQDDIDKEVADINDTLKSFNVYPVVNMGLSYRF